MIHEILYPILYQAKFRFNRCTYRYEATSSLKYTAAILDCQRCLLDSERGKVAASLENFYKFLHVSLNWIKLNYSSTVKVVRFFFDSFNVINDTVKYLLAWVESGWIATCRGKERINWNVSTKTKDESCLSTSISFCRTRDDVYVD